MTTRYELDVTITSAKNLKNINWRHGPLKPYAVVWVDPKNKRSTHVDEVGDESPVWNEKLTIPIFDLVEDSVLHIDIVHANPAEDIKPLIGSAKVKLNDVVEEVGIGHVFDETLELKRPSGRPHGKVEVKVCVKQPQYRAPDPYYPSPYGVPPPQPYPAPPPYGGSYHYAAPPSGYPYGGPPAYGGVQPAYGGGAAAYSGGAAAYGGGAATYSGVPAAYGGGPAAYGGGPAEYGAGPAAYGGGQAVYGGGQQAYGGGQPGGYQGEKKSKYGMGTGLAVGVAAGLLGGLAIAEGVDYVEDKIAEDVAEKVEDDLGYDVDDD